MVNIDIYKRFLKKKIYETKLCNKCKEVKDYKQYRQIKTTSISKWKYLQGFRGSKKTLHYSICKKCESKDMERRYNLNPIPQMISNAKIRAKQKGVPFKLTATYIKSIWPTDNKCPVLNVKFEMGYSKVGGKKKNKTYSPSLDRVNPKKGYVPGNLVIISDIVNRMKQDATLDIMEKIYKFYKKRQNDKT